MFDLFAPLVVGLAGSLHCLGMCGPLVVAYSLQLQPAATQGVPKAPRARSGSFIHHLAFHAGRLLTYGFLGALASLVGYAAGLSQLFAGLRSSVTLVGGLLMVLFGLALLKLIPLPLSSLPSLGKGSFFGRIFPLLFASRRGVSKFALGLATGFLPCMLSWAMIVKAATAPSPAHGFITMLLFGLGTVPLLFSTGLSASFFTLKTRLAGERVAACSVIVMGLILLVKGAKYFA
jgi:hypothetical protein